MISKQQKLFVFKSQISIQKVNKEQNSSQKAELIFSAKIQSLINLNLIGRCKSITLELWVKKQYIKQFPNRLI